MSVPSLSPRSFMDIERSLGTAFEEMTYLPLEKKSVSMPSNTKISQSVPACTVIVNGGWSKGGHKHSYNANSVVGVIFGAYSKKLLYIDIYNKHCCTCAIAERSSNPIPPH